MTHVGIIGAGAAGLCALKRSLSVPGWRVTAWEQSSVVGGTWVLDERTGTNEYGYPIFSSMYHNLRTNLPKEIMGFLNYPFPEEKSSFVHHTSVRRYLQSYAEHFNLLDHIKFSHNVESVKPLFQDSGLPKWCISVKNLETQSVERSSVDFIFICNGHYANPQIPVIDNIQKFSGRIMHSHDYRSNDSFANDRVAVFGAGASGVDIAIELCSVAEKVYLCHDLITKPTQLPNNLLQLKGIQSAEEDGFILKDGTRIHVNALLYCTGYMYSFPFLDESCGIKVIENRVTPLYKHLLHTRFPSMGMPSLNVKILPFPLFDVQIQYLISVFRGHTKIPSTEEMDADTQRELEDRKALGQPLRHFHYLGSLQWPYIEDLVKLSNQKMFPKVIQQIYNAVSIERTKHTGSYKNFHVIMKNSDTFEIVKS